METYYKRTDDIDQKIHSVKLPYIAWKVLFLIDDKQSVANLKELLGEEEATLQEALKLLTAEGLITETGEKAEEAEEPQIAEKEESPEKPEAEEQTSMEEKPPAESIEAEAEEEAEEEPFTEIIEEEFVEETIIKKEVIEPEVPVEEAETEPEAEETEKEVSEPDFFAEEEPDIVIGKAKEEAPEEKEPEQEKPAEEEKKAEDVTSAEEEKPQEESLFDLQGELEDSSVFEGIETEEETAEQPPEIEIPEEEKEEETIKLDLDFDQEIAQEPVAEETIPTETPLHEGEGIILVIDDSIVIRKMVELALENENFQIETAVTGKDGLKLLDQLQPDLVLLDLMLPDINGIDLLKTIKASKGIPVVMLSGKDSPQMIEKARAEGADAFLPKPFRDEELVQTIKNLIKK